MTHSGQLGEMLCRYLSTSQRAVFLKLGKYNWFYYEDKKTFQEALEPLAYAVKLGLEKQVQNYFSHITNIYLNDVSMKATHVIRKELGGDGSVLRSSNIKITPVDDVNTLLPDSTLSAMKRLAEEGFTHRDFGIARRVGHSQLTLILRIGNRWLQVMSWRAERKRKNRSW